MSLFRKKVFTAGCFNRLHSAHLTFLAKAKSHGDNLVIVVAHDVHNRKPNAIPASLRKWRLEKLGIAERVIVGDPDRFAGMLERERPDILVLGYDQRIPDEETEGAVRRLGIQVIRLAQYPGKEETLLGMDLVLAPASRGM